MEVYGFTLLEEVLNPEEVSHLRECLIRCYERTGHEQNFMGTAGHVTNLPTQDPLFFPLLDHPKILPILEAILGKNLILGSLNARIARPADDEQRQIWRGDVHPSPTSSDIIRMKPPMKPSVAMSVYLSRCVSGMTSSITT